MREELLRKSFHLLGLLYVAGFFILPREGLLICLGGLLVMDVLIEWARLKNPSFRKGFHSLFGALIREKEEDRFTGTFWMLLGILGTALIVRPSPIAATAVLYLILGDGIASIAGKGLKGPRWHRSKKTVSGSAACFLMCILVGIILLLPAYGWRAVFGGAFAATLLEYGCLPLNDNLAIPLGSSAVLLLVCRIPLF